MYTRNGGDTLTSTQLCTEAGITYRQLDYWLRNGVIPSSYVTDTTGSGHHRQWDPDVIAPLRVIGQVSAAVQLSCAQYADIFVIHDHGSYELAPGVTLTWTP